MKKYIYIIICIVFLGLSCFAAVTTVQNKSLKSEKKLLVSQVQQQAKTIETLGEMEAVALKITFTINNKAVFGSIKNGDLQPYIDAAMSYSRSELMKDKYSWLTIQLNKPV